jgi:hypothetical protein
MLEPAALPYDIAAWRRAPFAERVRLVCQAWAIQGYGTPRLIYVAYLLKVALVYVGGWWLFCSLSPGLGDPSALAQWAFEPVAFQKAVLWSMAYEGLGLGCGSGPLTGRYRPPIGGPLYWLRPGTTKIPLFGGIPVVGGHRRTWLDVGLYLAHYAFLFRALAEPVITAEHLWPTAIFLPLIGLSDKTIFLASRAEHYFVALLCFVAAGAAGPEVWVAGCKWIWVAIWMWAATSKLNRHFPSVVCVMLSNSPFVPAALCKRLYRSYPEDLRPSRVAAFLGHAGTSVEYAFPLVLLISDGGVATAIGLGVMVMFHVFITSHVPMGVPIEWNVLTVYGAAFLFGERAAASLGPWTEQPLLAGVLALSLLAIPLAGNLFPHRVSFLPSMRYYAGNWAYSVWLFRGDASKKLDELVKPAPNVREQLASMYDDDQIDGLMSKVIAFRSMHLHGRALQRLLPKAVDDIELYEWLDGEIVAGLALGWNFGDGHLHDERLLRAIQAQCRFEPGELRCIMVESQPLGRATLAWRIVDAASGPIARGEVDVRELTRLQPWPTSGLA